MDGELFRLNAEMEFQHWWFLGRRRILREIIEHVLPPSPTSLVIDVGCGTGGNASELARRYPCVGIDPSREAIELARRRFPHVRFLHGRVPDDLGGLARTAKLFLLADVLEHVADDAALLRAVCSVARPGAFLLLTVPADMLLWSPHDVIYGHYRRYSPEQLESTWRGLPLRPLLVSHFNARLYGVVRLVRWINARLGQASGAKGTDLRVPIAPVNSLLAALLAGERKAIRNMLNGRRRDGYRHGVSLLALLEYGDPAAAEAPMWRPRARAA